MAGVFRTSSERLAMALLGTPARRRTMAGAALLAYTTLRPIPRRDGDGSTAVMDAAPRLTPAVTVRPPAPALTPRIQPVGPPPVARAFSLRDRRIFGWLLMLM